MVTRIVEAAGHGWSIPEDIVRDHARAIYTVTGRLVMRAKAGGIRARLRALNRRAERHLSRQRTNRMNQGTGAKANYGTGAPSSLD